MRHAQLDDQAHRRGVKLRVPFSWIAAVGRAAKRLAIRLLSRGVKR